MSNLPSASVIIKRISESEAFNKCKIGDLILYIAGYINNEYYNSARFIKRMTDNGYIKKFRSIGYEEPAINELVIRKLLLDFIIVIGYSKSLQDCAPIFLSYIIFQNIIAKLIIGGQDLHLLKIYLEFVGEWWKNRYTLEEFLEKYKEFLLFDKEKLEEMFIEKYKSLKLNDDKDYSHLLQSLPDGLLGRSYIENEILREILDLFDDAD